MTTILYAQPYNIDAEGFYFRSAEEYDRNVSGLTDSFGQPVEEFEIQFIDGELIDCQLAKAVGINQANFRHFLEATSEWDDHDKTRFIIAAGECGYSIEPDSADLDDIDLDIYEEDSLRDLAFQFVDEGLFGEVPESFRFYIDYDAIARDLAVDYSETEIAGKRLIYRCG